MRWVDPDGDDDPAEDEVQERTHDKEATDAHDRKKTQPDKHFPSANVMGLVFDQITLEFIQPHQIPGGSVCPGEHCLPSNGSIFEYVGPSAQVPLGQRTYQQDHHEPTPVVRKQRTQKMHCQKQNNNHRCRDETQFCLRSSSA